jgi:hypothetical protein
MLFQFDIFRILLLIAILLLFSSFSSPNKNIKVFSGVFHIGLIAICLFPISIIIKDPPSKFFYNEGFAWILMLFCWCIFLWVVNFKHLKNFGLTSNLLMFFFIVGSFVIPYFFTIFILPYFMADPTIDHSGSSLMIMLCLWCAFLCISNYKRLKQFKLIYILVSLVLIIGALWISGLLILFGSCFIAIFFVWFVFSRIFDRKQNEPPLINLMVPVIGLFFAPWLFISWNEFVFLHRQPDNVKIQIPDRLSNESFVLAEKIDVTKISDDYLKIPFPTDLKKGENLDNQRIYEEYYPKTSNDWLRFTDTGKDGMDLSLVIPKGFLILSRGLRTVLNDYYETPFTKLVLTKIDESDEIHKPFNMMVRLAYQLVARSNDVQAEVMITRLQIDKNQNLDPDKVLNDFSYEKEKHFLNKHGLKIEKYQNSGLRETSDYLVKAEWSEPSLNYGDRVSMYHEYEAYWISKDHASIYLLSFYKNDIAGIDTDPNAGFILF